MDEKARLFSTIHEMTSAFDNGDVEAVMCTYEAGAVVVDLRGGSSGCSSSTRRLSCA